MTSKPSIRFHIYKQHVSLEPLIPLSILTVLEDIVASRSDPHCLLMAVMDKQREKVGLVKFADVYRLFDVDDALNAAFGMINILPRYQRTHVSSHGMYLVLTYLSGTLHLARVQYNVVIFDTQSIRSRGERDLRGWRIDLQWIRPY
ncbi:hypothetical protein L204_102483 [Cryptococcus depauperatus]